jgi:hypothetical protein
VTHDSPTEVTAVNLTGTEDALSVSLNGNDLYLGRRSGARPELLAFDIPTLISGSVSPVATSEVGADVHTIQAVGELLLLGTSKSGEEFQVWNKNSAVWNQTVLNTGRVSFTNIPHLTPHGIDISGDFVYLQNQSATTPESLTVLSIP